MYYSSHVFLQCMLTTTCTYPGIEAVLILFQESTDVCQYAPIAASLYNLDSARMETTKRKFDVAYTICKQNMAFSKMAPLCELLERHGVDLGTGYKNEKACATFVDYISQEQRSTIVNALAKARFFSLQLDGSTDAGNVEDEVFLVVLCDPFSTVGKIRVRNEFLTVRQPGRATAESLFSCLRAAMGFLGVANWEHKLIGMGCDGASVNLGSTSGLKGLLTEAMPWIVVFWCLAHRLELALKDALKDTFFMQVDEMLLRIYYLYEKSPQKCVELDDIISELKQCLEPSDLPTKGGNRPLRACGTRFVAHKVVALQRVTDRLGAYLSHLSALIEDPSVKSVDKQKLKGYMLKWHDAKILLGCAYFHDLLKPAAILCKVLQEDEVCVVSAIEAILKTAKNLEKVKSTPVDNLPTVKVVLSRITHENDTTLTTYQGADLKNFTEAVSFFKANHSQYCALVQACLKDHLATQETELLSHALTLLATQEWEKDTSDSFAHPAIQALSVRFQIPLQQAQINISLLEEEWDDMVDHARRYLDLVTQDNNVVWWKRFNGSNAKNWGNILGLVELLFCLPMSNGHVERVFSQLKVIKTDRRTGLGEDRLDNLLGVASTGPQLSEWDPTHAVELWWSDKRRRCIQDERAPPRKKQCIDQQRSDTDSQTGSRVTLDDWEEWAL